MVSCGICGQAASFSKKFYCASCTSYLVLDERISLINSGSEVASLARDIDQLLVNDTKYQPYHKRPNPGVDVPSSHIRNVGVLKTRANWLRSQNQRIRHESNHMKNDINSLRQDEVERVRDTNEMRRIRLKQMREELEKKYRLQKSAIISRTTSKQEAIRHTTTSINHLQTRFCKELTHLFGIRRRRRKNNDHDASSSSYDIILGFSIVPDLSNLAHYSQSTLNIALERLAYFCTLSAYYLDIRLPYEILLPQRNHCYVRMAHFGWTTKHSIYLTTTVTHMAQERPKEFENYVEGLSMLALCLLDIATSRDIQIENNVEEAAQINRVLSRLYRELIPSSEQQPNNSIPTPSPSPAPGSNLPESTINLETLQDYIINQSYLIINGGSNEWDLIDKEAAIGSLVDKA